MIQEWQHALEGAVRAAKAPGAAAYVAANDVVLYHGAAGLRQSVPQPLPAARDTIYDLASITKVVATTTAVMLLRDDGVLDLDQPVAEIVPVPAFRAFTIRHLLTHSAGLSAILPLYRSVSTVNEALQRIAAAPLLWAPGSRRRYSDLGYIILGKVVELAAMDSLDAFCARRIFAPLGMTHTGFRPPEAWREMCAATEHCPWRGRVICGEVHDENAYAVGGVSGHAGLFGTAEDLARFCRALIEGRILARRTLEEMARIGQLPCYPWQGLGWQLDPWMAGSSGFLPARTVIGHTGWTGTSLWLDYDAGNFVILLSNTCHPSRAARNNGALRRVFHAPVAARLYPRRINTHTGLDRVMWDDFAPLRGKRIALLANHAATDQTGRSILDVIALCPDIALTRLYSPEHGLWAQAEAGEKVQAQAGPIPVISLYGGQQRPSQEQLRGVDLFVVDLPDIGSRYYTYMATMKECMTACAQARVPVMVLDRPNPIGGVIMEGGIARETGSIVCCAPIPARHAMTLGEIALFFRQTVFNKTHLNLTIVQADNWFRDRLFMDCSLPWTPPSPNIPTPETALVYAGTCLFEGVNMNEGRGTDTPFLIVGAPWLRAERILDMLGSEEHPGCRLEAVTYTPRAIPGKATSPRYKDLPCHGLRIHVEQPEQVRAFTTAIAILCAVQREHPGELQWEKHFDTLAGGPRLRRSIQAGDDALTIVARFDTEHRTFDRGRPKRYLTAEQWLRARSA